jgi:glycosyltransferase involved in cell wall biosynthesis
MVIGKLSSLYKIYLKILKSSESMTQKRIVILHYAGPPIVGGVESTIYHHSRLLIKAGFDVDVIAGRGEKFLGEVQFHRIPEIDSRHSKAEEIGRTLAKGTVNSDFYEFRDFIIEKVRPLISSSATCIVHNALSLHFNFPLTAALRHLSEEKACQIIAWNHDFAWRDKLYLSDMHHGYPWDLLRTPWPGVRYVVVSSHRQTMQAELLGIPESKIEVITPGVDYIQFLNLNPLTREIITKLDLVKADPLMLLPARVIPRKNLQFAVRVAAALKELKPQPVLVITGPPDPHNPKIQAYLQSLKQLREDLDVDKVVYFLYELGKDDQPLYLPDEVVADLYRFSDLLLFPTLREGFGIPVLEAGLVNLPVFAADIPTVYESAGDYANLFDPNGDPKKVAEEIARFLENSDSYKLRKRVVNNFTWQAIIEKKIIPLINEVTRQE